MIRFILLGFVTLVLAAAAWRFAASFSLSDLKWIVGLGAVGGLACASLFVGTGKGRKDS